MSRPKAKYPRQEAQRLAKKLNVILEREQGGGETEIEATAPMGYHFVSTGTHAVVAAGFTDEGVAQLWQSTLDDLLMGTEKCSSSDCELWEESLGGCTYWADSDVKANAERQA